MKRKLFCSIIVTAGLLLGGCAESIESQQAKDGARTAQNDSLKVGFDAYQNRTTRSGLDGVLNIDRMKYTEAEGGGFGVFAYYTDLKKYDQTYVPNFMYNQGVFYNMTSGLWEYTPIMYWPNEYGFDAASDDEDHVTFFAYAPYVNTVSHAAGSVDDATYGITGFSRNTATGDPMVKYIASFDPAKSVDLCWGVVPDDKTSWGKIQGGSTQTLAAGFPWLDIERPLETATQAAATTSRIKFKFNHALAQLNVQIDTDADVTTHYDAGDELDPRTKVYVRSISFTGIALKGALNLNNSVKNQAQWLDYNGLTDLPFGQSVTIHDGRRDTREGVAGAEAANETPTGLNPDIIQNSTATPGVIHEYQNLFAPTSPIAVPGSPTPAELQARLEDAICVIPTGESMEVTIVYDIEMEDPDLTSYLSDGKTHGLSIENKVSKTVTFGGVTGAGLESNKRYTLKLHLGMNSVKFDAEITDWADNTINGEGWLPSNTRPIMLNHTVLYLGAPQTLVATTDPMGMPVAWENADATYASIPTSSPYTARGATRVVTPQSIPSGVTNAVKVTPQALGTTTITATLASGEKAVCDVYVVPIVLTSPNNTAPSNAINETVGRKATVRLESSLFPATSAPSGVTWTASPAGIVTLTPDPGDPTKCDVTGDAVGTVTITAQNGTYPTTATCTMDVTSKPPTVTAPSLQPNWTYDTTTKDLLTTAGSVTGGTMSYSLDGSTWYTTYNDAALQTTNAGSYPVYYKVVGDPGYDDVPTTLIGTVLVSKATPTITLSATSATVYAKGVPATFTATPSNASESPTLSVSTTNGTASISTGTVKAQGGTTGSGTVTVTSSPTTNYNAGTATFALTVNPKTKEMNPLWYVAYYNVNNAAGDTFGSTDTDAYYYSWNSAMTTFTGSTTPYDTYQVGSVTMTNGEPGATYHLPGRTEYFSIVPLDRMTNAAHLKTGSSSCNVLFGYNTATKAGITDNSYWWQASANEIYAIRFIGTDYCSAWKYEFVNRTASGCDVVKISSIMIDYVETASDAVAWYSANWGSLTFTDNDLLLAAERVFYCNGWANSQGSTPDGGTFGRCGYYVTASQTVGDANSRTYLFCGWNGLSSVPNSLWMANDNMTGYYIPVRLFRD